MSTFKSSQVYIKFMKFKYFMIKWSIIVNYKLSVSANEMMDMITVKVQVHDNQRHKGIDDHSYRWTQADKNKKGWTQAEDSMM